MSLVIKESIRILSSFILSNTKLSNTIESNFVLSTLVDVLLNPIVLKLHEKNNVIKDKNKNTFPTGLEGLLTFGFPHPHLINYLFGLHLF